MRLRTVIALATVIPLLSVGVAIVPRLANERWEEMVAWQQQAEREWRQRDFERDADHGTLADGAAMPHYLDAMEQAATLGKADAQLLTDLRLRPETVDAAAAEAFALRWRPALAALQRGAHSRDWRPHVDWQRGIRQAGLRLQNGRNLVNAAAIEVRARLQRGTSRAAVELLLDAATFAVDLQASPLFVDQIMASSWLAIAAAEILGERELLQLDDAALRLLADGLLRLDARCCRRLDGRWETMLLARSLIDADAAAAVKSDQGGDGRLLEATGGWRYGWSRRWSEADAVMTLVLAYGQMATSADWAWPRRREHLRELEAGFAANRNAIVRAIAPTWSGFEHTLRMVATQVQLLRMAVALRIEREPADLPDPLGDGALQVLREGDHVVVRSAGGSDEHPLQRRVAAR